MRRILGVVGLCLLCGGVSALSAAEDSEAPQEFTVAEDAGPGTTIGLVNAADQGPGTGVTFQIVPDGATVPWRIDPITGELTLGDAHLDFESQQRYQLTVRVRSPRALDPARRAYLADLLASGVDPDSLDDVLFQVAEQVVTVDVVDAQEPPVLSAAEVTLVVRNSAEPAQVQITVADPDAGETHTFELVDADPQQFAIDPQSGVLTCLKAANTADGTIPVTVRVTDSAGLSTTATYNVELVVPVTAVAASSTSNAAESPTAAAAPPLTPAASVNDDVPPDMDDEPTVAAAPAPPVETANDAASPAVTHPAAAESNPESAAAALVATPDQTGDAAPAAASQGGLAIWLPLTVLAVGLVVLGVFWLRRQREQPVMDAQPPKFRVVREARMLNAASAAGPRESEESPANTPALDAGAVADETAAVHQLLASAFQQAVGKPEAQAAPVAVAEPQAILPPPPEIVPSVEV
ncbi:MAG: cadherin domain-containing protein [Planctomycetaceae bacterium]